MQVDSSDGSRPSRASTIPTTATGWHALVEDHCRNYDIDGIMWCNERHSPLDTAIAGVRAELLLRRTAELRPGTGIDVERVRVALTAM